WRVCGVPSRDDSWHRASRPLHTRQRKRLRAPWKRLGSSLFRQTGIHSSPEKCPLIHPAVHTAHARSYSYLLSTQCTRPVYLGRGRARTGCPYRKTLARFPRTSELLLDVSSDEAPHYLGRREIFACAQFLEHRLFAGV